MSDQERQKAKQEGGGAQDQLDPSPPVAPPSSASIRVALSQLESLWHLLNAEGASQSSSSLSSRSIADLLPSLLLPLAPLPIPPSNLTLQLHPAHTVQLVAQQRRAHYKSVAQHALELVAQLIRDTKAPDSWPHGPHPTDVASQQSLASAIALVENLQGGNSRQTRDAVKVEPGLEEEDRKQRLLQVRRKRRKLQQSLEQANKAPSVKLEPSTQTVQPIQNDDHPQAPFINIFGVQQIPTPQQLHFPTPTALSKSLTCSELPAREQLDLLLQLFDDEANSRNSSAHDGKPSEGPMYVRSHLCDIESVDTASTLRRFLIQLDIRDVLRAFVDVEFVRTADTLSAAVWRTRIVIVNVRAPSEYDPLPCKVPSRARPAHSRSPSRFPYYCGISALVFGRSLEKHAARLPGASSNHADGLLHPLWEVMQHLVAFRSVFDAPPSTEAQFRAEQAQAQQARASLGLLDGESTASEPSPWFVRTTLPDQAAQTGNARWAWCVRERAQQPCEDENGKGPDEADKSGATESGQKDDEVMRDETSTAAAESSVDNADETLKQNTSIPDATAATATTTIANRPTNQARVVEEGEWRAFHPACAVSLPIS